MDPVSVSTPLHGVCRCRDALAAQLLLDRGADVNARDSIGRTPLHAAAYSDHMDTVVLLVDRGADVNARDSNGDTPLHAAAYSRCGNDLVATLLLDRGADVNATGSIGRTPLHAAAVSRCGNVLVAKLLLDRGADMESRDSRGNTPLECAGDGGGSQGGNGVFHLLRNALARRASGLGEDRIETLRRTVLETRVATLALERDYFMSGQRLCEAEDDLRLAEEEANAARRKTRFIEDLDNECFVCLEKFSKTVGTPSFNVVSFPCRCTGNARMVHLHCWAQFPEGEEKCGNCSSATHLVDEAGNNMHVTVRRGERTLTPTRFRGSLRTF